LAEYTTGFYRQTPAITENSYGNGITWYVGTEPGQELMEDIVKYFTNSSDIEPLGIASEDVEMMTRDKDKKRWLFVINHTNEEQVYHLNDFYTMLEGEGKEVLKPYEVQLFVKDIR
jgi:beta-galactosidase